MLWLSWIFSSILRYLCCHHKLMVRCHTKFHQQQLVQQISKLKKWRRAVIAALIENQSCAFPFSCWQVSTYFISYWRLITLIYSHTNEIVILQAFATRVHCPLPQCYEVTISWRPLTFHKNYGVSYVLQKFSYEILEFIDIFNTTKIWRHMVGQKFSKFDKFYQIAKFYSPNIL